MCKADTTDAKTSSLLGKEKEQSPMVRPDLQKTFIKAYEPQGDFHWVGTDEPHATRRKLMLAKYPEIKQLFGPEPRTKYIIAAVVALQTYCAVVLAPTLTWPWFLALAYIVGGTSNHAMMMGMHELSHNLGFKGVVPNRLLGIFANFPLCVPSAISFKRYHMEHHRYQGEAGIDGDLPTVLEGKLFTNTITKFLFVIFQVFFYGLRPLIVNPKPPQMWELVNWIGCMGYNYAVYQAGGSSALVYLLLSTFLGAGIHPVAGHFIAEHYVFILGYETYSYYGILNWVTFNVGYHNEHHDFPYVAGSRLHRIREIAPEFYDNLPQHKSWVAVMVEYVLNPNIGAFSRIKRETLTDEQKHKMKND